MVHEHDPAVTKDHQAAADGDAAVHALDSAAAKYASVSPVTPSRLSTPIPTNPAPILVAVDERYRRALEAGIVANNAAAEARGGAIVAEEEFHAS